MSLVSWNQICFYHKEGELDLMSGYTRSMKYLAKYFNGTSSLWTRMVSFKYKLPTPNGT